MAKKFKRFFLSKLTESVIRASEADARIRAAALQTPEEALAALGTANTGLRDAQVEAAREKLGANALPAAKKRGILMRLAAAFVNPFTAILFVLALVSVFTDIVFAAAGEKNYMTVIVISCMVGASGILRFAQETRSGNAAARLAAMVSSKCDVLRGDRAEITSEEIVVGDIVCLSAGCHPRGYAHPFCERSVCFAVVAYRRECARRKKCRCIGIVFFGGVLRQPRFLRHERDQRQRYGTGPCDGRGYHAGQDGKNSFRASRKDIL